MKAAPTHTFKYLPLSVCIDTLGGLATPLAPRGTPLPAKRSERFSTAADHQSTVELSLSLGERPLAKDNMRIGTFRMDGIPPAMRGLPEITVSFQIDETCAVTATATIAGSQVRAEEIFQPPMELSSETIARLIAEAAARRVEDEAALHQIEATNRATNLLAKAEAALKDGPNGPLGAAVAALGLALDSGDVESIRRLADALNEKLAAPVDFPPDMFASLFGAPFGPSPAKRTSGPRVSPRRPGSSVALEAQASPEPYVHLDRIMELKACKATTFDLKKLVALCEELNIADRQGLVLAVGMLVRAVLDHVPPLFGCKGFAEVANNYTGARSFKEAMGHLENTSRKIADSFLHIQIRKSEALPNKTQVDFRNALDMLLQEIVRLQK